MTDPNPRVAEADVDPRFLERWSPRALAPDPIPEPALRALFEAARWAPSSYNEQPWLFVYAAREADLARFRPLLVEQNRAWADAAPVLAVVFARRAFARNGKPNRHHAFDAGAAWMSLALEARRQGLFAHAMAGFSEERAYEVCGVPKAEYEAMAAVAVGRPGDPARLPEPLRERERPSGRKPLAETAVEGRLR